MAKLRKDCNKISSGSGAKRNAGLVNIVEIAAVESVDALFIGPSDHAASMGYLGQPTHPAVVEAIATIKAALDRAGKPAGIFAVNPEHAR